MRPDRTQAVLASCVAVVRNDKTSLKVERGRRLWNILAGLTQTPDLVLEPATLLTGDRDVGALPEATQARRVVMDVARAVQLGGMRR
jgi:hypothetical protein